MKKKTFYLIAAAMAALSAGEAPAQRVVSVAADYPSADFGRSSTPTATACSSGWESSGRCTTIPKEPYPTPSATTAIASRGATASITA